MKLFQQVRNLAGFTRFYLRYAGGRFYLLTALEMLNSALQGVGILLILPLLSLSGYLDYDASDRFSTFFLSLVHGMDAGVTLPAILVFYVALNVLVALSTYIQKTRTIRLQQGFLKKIRCDMYSQILRSEWEYLVRQQHGTMTFSSTTDIQLVYMASIQLLNTVMSCLQLAIGVIVCALLSVKLTVLACVTGSIYLGIQIFFLRRSYDNAAMNRGALRMLFSEVMEGLSGLKLIKGHACESASIASYSVRASNIERNALERQRIQSAQTLIQTVVLTVLVAVYAYVALRWMLVRGALFALFVILLVRITRTIRDMLTQSDMLLKNLPSFFAYRRQMDQLRGHCEYGEEGESTEPVRLDESIAFSDVSFSYPQSERKQAVRNLTLEIPARRTTAISGPSGSGKTTLVDLLLGLLVPESGRICIDGQPLGGTLRRRWRHSLAYVPQEPFLFDDTIRNNLLAHSPDVTEPEMWAALEVVQAKGFVSRLPRGLDTLVGDRGTSLSGGERQRIAIARALLRKSDILILDEATSNLDGATEKAIQDAVDRLQGSMTILIIAHRLSTIENADRTILMENGTVTRIVDRNA